MAKVPVSERQVRPERLPASRFAAGATALSFGGAEAEQIGQVGTAISQFGRDLQNQALIEEEYTDRALVRDELNEGRNEARQFMAGVYERRGKDAIDSFVDVDDKLDEIRQTRIQNLTTNRQKDMFSASYDSIANGHKDRVISFQSKSRKEYEIKTITAENQNAIEDASAALAAEIKNSIGGAAATYTAIYEIKSAEETITANTKYINRNFSKVIIDLAVRNAVHNLHSSLLESIQKDFPEVALSYFNQNIAKFNPSARAALKEGLEKEAQDALIRDTAINLSASGLTLEVQLAHVDNIDNVAVADEVRKRVKVRDKEKTDIETAKVNSYVESEWDIMFDNPVAYQIPYTNLPEKTQRSMEKYKKQVLADDLAAKGVGTKAPTDWRLYTDLKTMSDKEFAEMDLTKHINSLNPTEYKELVNEQKSVRKKDAQVYRLRTPYAQAKGAISGMDDFDPKDEDNTERTQQYYSSLNKAITLIPENERTEERIRVLVNELLAPISTGWFDAIRGKNLYSFELPFLEQNDKRVIAYSQNIPNKLKGFQNVNYSPEAEMYYVDGSGIRDIYDKYGNYVKSYGEIDTK